MKLTDLLINQRLIVQLVWGDRKIEFDSDVIENDGTDVYVSPYLHNGSPLAIDVTPDKGVICNIFTDKPTTRQRISWKGIELTTVDRNGKTLYCIKTRGFNNTANPDDRRLHERVVIEVRAKAFDGQSKEGVDIIVRDISDIGLSFYVLANLAPKSSQVIITFTDNVDGREFNVRVECSVARSTPGNGNVLVGCKIIGENRDYLMYGFIKRLKDKNRFKIIDTAPSEENTSEEEAQTKEQSGEQLEGKTKEQPKEQEE